MMERLILKDVDNLPVHVDGSTGIYRTKRYHVVLGYEVETL
jgi:hypothetical protein